MSSEDELLPETYFKLKYGEVGDHAKIEVS